MKTITVFGALAAVASAYSPARHLRFPRANATEPLTTMTIKNTQIQTITSCAATITNCPTQPEKIADLPKNQRVTMIVTNTFVLATTVCPVADANKISSSVVAKVASQEASSSVVAKASSQKASSSFFAKASSTGSASNSTISISQVNLPTISPSPSSAKFNLTNLAGSSSTVLKLSTKSTAIVTNKIFSNTTSSTASVTPRTSRSSPKETVTPPRKVASSGSGNGSGSAPSTSTNPAATTTRTATSKITHTVTIFRATPVPVDGPANGPGGGPAGNPRQSGPVGANKPSNPAQGDCPASTVTLTLPASTVFVTVSAGSAPNQKPAASQPANGGSQQNGGNKDGNIPGCPEAPTSSPAVSTSVRFPAGNSTQITGTGTGRLIKPTGFARFRR